MERFWVLAVMAVMWIALGGCASQPQPEPRNVAATPEATRSEAHEECESGAIVEHAFSSSDDSDLVGFSDNVFVGRVEKRVGTTGVKPGRPMGSTQFSVTVLENVKGRVGGVVTVSQEGAYDPERGCTMLMEDDPLLEPGDEIMFFTRHDEGRGWHQIVSAGYGDRRIESERQREELVRRFERAQKNQTDPLR
jgi:hypothetical protein